MKGCKRLLYELQRSCIRLYCNSFIDFRVYGKNNIPPGPKIFYSNHLCSYDPLYASIIMHDPIHMILKDGFNIPIIRKLLSFTEQINALPKERSNVVNLAVSYLNKGQSIYIFPEGSLTKNPNKLNTFYAGIARIAQQHNAAIIPIALYALDRDMKIKKSSRFQQNRDDQTKTILTGRYSAQVGKSVNITNTQKKDIKLTLNKLEEELLFNLSELKLKHNNPLIK